VNHGRRGGPPRGGTFRAINFDLYQTTSRRKAPEMDAVKLLEKLSDQLSVRRAFGAAYEKDGVLIIPVAIVAGGGGGGASRPGRANPAARTASPLGEGDPAADNASHDAASVDAGGGFGGLILPSGVYVVKGDQVRWVPAVDVTIAVLASLGLVRILTRSWTRRKRRSG
jgi:uncharacterized spore protein YtfJ